MERLRKTFSFRKKKKKKEPTDANKPQQWLEDEKKVREGTCSFQVKYLGHIEVFESRGLQVCEEAIKALRKSQKKTQRAILYVSGDALRVVDEISKGLIVDQTIEKVSFCAPDRCHEKGFAYICRDGATRRWICHGFLAVKESGERLSHAVGCAFAICLEKKQKREKEAVEVTYNKDETSFQRLGSFRQVSLTERLQDPQSAIIAEPVASKTAEGSPKSPPVNAVPRPHAPISIVERQASLRLLNNPTSPFKRDLSLRLNDLPSNLQRVNHALSNGDSIVEETSPDKEESGAASSGLVSQVASDFAQQLQMLTANASNDAAWAAAPAPTPAAAGAATSISGGSNNNTTTKISPDFDPFASAPVNPSIKQSKSPLNTTRNIPQTVSNSSAFNTSFNTSGSGSHTGGAFSAAPVMALTSSTSPFQPASNSSPLHRPVPNSSYAIVPSTIQHGMMSTSPYGNMTAFHQPAQGVSYSSTNPWSSPAVPSWPVATNALLSWGVPQSAPQPPMRAVQAGWSPSITGAAASTTAPPQISFNSGDNNVKVARPSDPFDLAWTEKGRQSSGGGVNNTTSTNPFLSSATAMNNNSQSPPAF